MRGERLLRAATILVLTGVVVYTIEAIAAEPAAKDPPPPPSTYEVRELGAFLFYDRLGALGARNVAEPYPEGASDDRGTPRDLYHAMSGGEVEDGPSNSTIVVVTLRRPRFLSHKATGRLKLIATNKAGRVLFSETRTLEHTGSAFASLDHKVPFLIPWTSCAPVILEARLSVTDLGVVSKALIKRVIPFGCHD